MPVELPPQAKHELPPIRLPASSDFLREMRGFRQDNNTLAQEVKRDSLPVIARTPVDIATHSKQKVRNEQRVGRAIKSGPHTIFSSKARQGEGSHRAVVAIPRIDGKHASFNPSSDMTTSVYSALQQEEGLNSFVDQISRLKTSELEKLSDLKANAFENLGLGELRTQLAESELVGRTKEMTKDIIQAINRYDINQEQLQSIIENLINDLVEDGVTPSQLAWLGIISGIGVLAYELKKSKNLSKTIVVLNLLLVACNGVVPTVQPQEQLPQATQMNEPSDAGGESATGGEVESQNKVVITEEIALDYFDNFSSYSYTNRDWSLISSIDLARGKDGSLTIAHPVIDKEVKTGLDIVKGSATFQAKEDGEGVITQKRNLLAVEGKDGNIHSYILLFDKDQSTISSDRAVLRYRLGIFVEDEKILIEIKGGWYTEELKAGEDGKAQLVKASITDLEIDLIADIVEESGVGEPTLEPTPPASFADGSFDDIVQSITGAEEVLAAPQETEEVVILPTGVESVEHLKEWDIGLDKDNQPVAVLLKGEGSDWISVPQDKLSQLPPWSQPRLDVSEDGTLRYVDANGKPLYALQGEKWIEEKELYYECGVGWFRIGIHKDIDPLGPDGEILPTGVYGTEFGFLGLKYFSATGCLLDEMTPVPEERFGVKNLYETKLGFWDSDGKLHGIPAIYGGGVANLGAKPTDQSLSLACFNNTCRAMPVEEAVEKLNTLYDSPNSNFQADFQIVLSQGENQQPDWSLRDYIIDNANLYLALKEAIKTGKNFPQLPEDFVVYLWQISMHE